MIERVTNRTPSMPLTNEQRWERRQAAYRALRNVEEQDRATPGAGLSRSRRVESAATYARDSAPGLDYEDELCEGAELKGYGRVRVAG